MRYSIPPRKPAAEGKTDSSLLTDGKRHEDGSSDLQNSVEYNGGSSLRLLDTTGVNLCVDLENVQPIGRVTLNINGHSRFRKPKEITCLASQDGVNFYVVETRRRRLGYASAEEPYTTFFHDGTAVVGDALAASEDDVQRQSGQTWQTLTFDLQGEPARYIGFNVKGSGTIVYLNELEVFADSSASAGPSDLYVPQRQSRFPIGHGLAPQDDVGFGPVVDALYIAKNITTPTFLHLKDVRRRSVDRAARFRPEYVISLPDGVKLIMSERLSAHGLRHDWDEANRRNVYTFSLDPTLNKNTETRIFKWEQLGPFYFKSNRDLAGDEIATFQVRTPERVYSEQRKPIHTLVIPEVVKPLPFYTGLTWMWESDALDWPDFFKSYKHIGFNYLPVFPRFYADADKSEGHALPKRVSELIETARKEGLGIVWNESPLHMITGSGARCESTDAAGRICPSYAGPDYMREMDRIRGISASLKADLFFADIEVFSGSSARARKECARCRAERAGSGLSIPAFFQAQGARIAEDVAAAARYGNPGIPIGLYAVAGGVYHGIFAFDDLYPEKVQLAQASLYEAGHLDVYHKAFVAGRAQAKENWKSIPWITAGTYGEFPAHKLESMIYDAVLNGNAVSFFCFLDFDSALDFQFVAKALANLSRHAELLQNGNPASYTGDNGRLFYSCFTNETEGLVHVGNYTSPETETVRLRSPLKGPVIIEDVRTGRVLGQDEEVSISIDPQRSALLLFKRIGD